MMVKELVVPDKYVKEKKSGFKSAWVKEEDRYLDPTKINLTFNLIA